MGRRIYKIVILLSISAVILILKSDNSKGCGWEPMPDDYYNIFDHKLFKLPLLKPFFLSDNDFFDYDRTGPLSPETANLKTWLKHFKNLPTIDNIDDIIYKSDKNDLIKIKEFLETGNPDSLKSKYENNTLIEYWKRHDYKSDLNYLIYAKECEPYVYIDDAWKPRNMNPEKMTELSKAGEGSYLKCKNNFLRDRYVYQMVRLLHYSGKYREAIDMYDKYFENGKHDLIQYWALEHKAGCLYSLKKYAEANLLFARIFNDCPSRRITCACSFKYGSDSLYNATLKLCGSTGEKTALITLAAYRSGEVNVDAMEKIYELDPKSNYLELLLERSISEMEREILPPRYDILEEYGVDYKYEITGPFKKLAEEVSKIAKENKTKHPYLWYFAAGYIYTLSDESSKAEEFYVKAKQLCPTNDLSYINRIKIAEIISSVNALTKIDKDAEAELYTELSWLRNNRDLVKLKSKDAFYYIMSILGAKYKAQNDTIKWNLCMGAKLITDDWWNYTNKPALGYRLTKDYYREPLQQIYDFIETKNLSLFEKFLVDNYCYDEFSLREIIGTKLLLEHKYNEAVKIFNPDGYYDYLDDNFKKLPADPFIIHINDCHDCDYVGRRDRTYNKLTFAERMAELENLAKTDTSNKAKYFFLLANGYYNTTMYGNNWWAIVYSQLNHGFYENISLNLPNEFYDCSTAQEYYTKAMNAAKDSEFAAECCFMASKCEQNTFYYRVEKDSINIYDEKKYFGLKSKYRNYFKILKDKYAKTKFFKEAIEECKYFNEFVKIN